MPGFAGAAAVRDAYVARLLARRDARDAWLPPLRDAAAHARPDPRAAGPAAGAADLAAADVTRHPFEYAAIRVVPRIERGEAINAGVLLYCRGPGLPRCPGPPRPRPACTRSTRTPTPTAIAQRAARPGSELCAGGPERERPDAGPAGEEDRGRRFRRLTAPRSTMVQPGPVHTGLTSRPRGRARAPARRARASVTAVTARRVRSVLGGRTRWSGRQRWPAPWRRRSAGSGHRDADARSRRRCARRRRGWPPAWPPGGRGAASSARRSRGSRPAGAGPAAPARASRRPAGCPRRRAPTGPAAGP